MIISVSRRTDIVAFYMDWFMRRIREGKAVYYNPFNYKGYEISLKPEDVSLFAFISKNYAPLLPFLGELKEKYSGNRPRLYFHYTITGLSRVFEEKVQPAEEMVKVFRELAAKTSPEQVEWRFDPIILTDQTPPEYYRKRFIELASALESSTYRCYFSFATIYDKVKRAFRKLETEKGIKLLKPELKILKQLADELASIGQQYGIQLYSCCNDSFVSDKVLKAHCVDGEHLSKLFDLKQRFPLYPTREDCGCVKCIDIGVYDTCPHGCIYCYANWNKQVAVKNYLQHKPEDELLLNTKIKVVKRLNDQNGEQISLF